MGYDAVDLINKAITIAIKRKTEYESIEKEKYGAERIKIVSRVLIKEIDRTIQYYENLKNEIGGIELEEINFVLYDKISFLINEFNEKIYIIKVNNVREYLRFSLQLEKDIYSILIDVQGRFVKNTDDVNTITYKTLSNIIKNKANYISELEKTLN